MPSTELEIVFWAAGVAVLYAYAGYPLLLAILARLRPARPVRRDEITPSVCVLLIAHDEELRLASKLRNCLELDYPRDLLEILVVSDGSSDRTEEIARQFADSGVRLVSLPRPARGKAAAIVRAVAETEAEILLFCDTRQELEPDALRQLVANFADPSVGAVGGELHIRVPEGATAGEGVGLYWRLEKLIRRLESRFDSTVGVSGCIYALRRELFEPIDPRTILDDVSIPMGVVLKGRRVLFEPRARCYDQLNEEARLEYRRKVRTLAGNYQLVWLRPALLDPRRNRLLWQFVSHKLARLAVPWCLLALLASSALLAAGGSSLHRLTFLAQAAFYALAILGLLPFAAHSRSRLLSVPSAFALLNLASASSLFGFLLGTQRAAWKRVKS